MGQHLDQSQGEETNFSAPLLFSFFGLWFLLARVSTIINYTSFLCSFCKLFLLLLPLFSFTLFPKVSRFFFHLISDFPALFPTFLQNAVFLLLSV